MLLLHRLTSSASASLMQYDVVPALFLKSFSVIFEKKSRERMKNIHLTSDLCDCMIACSTIRGRVS